MFLSTHNTFVWSKTHNLRDIMLQTSNLAAILDYANQPLSGRLILSDFLYVVEGTPLNKFQQKNLLLQFVPGISYFDWTNYSQNQ